MRDYKKIYDELFYFQVGVDGEELAQELCMDTLEYTSALLNGKTGDKQKERKFFDFINTLRQDAPTQEVINLFNYIFSNINTVGEWVQISIDSGYWEDVFESYKTPDEQIEAVCKMYAYLEWWARTIDLIPYYKSDVFYLELTLKIPDNFIKNTIQLFDYYHKKIIPRKALSELSNTPNQEQEPQEQEPQTPTNPILPSELRTPEAMKYWKKAQEAGLVDEHYQWLGTKVLLACFAKEMSDRFDLGKGINSDGSKRINWKIFENLFGESNLRGALNDLKKTGANPLNINLVNDIFK